MEGIPRARAARDFVEMGTCRVVTSERSPRQWQTQRAQEGPEQGQGLSAVTPAEESCRDVGAGRSWGGAFRVRTWRAPGNCEEGLRPSRKLSLPKPRLLPHLALG